MTVFEMFLIVLGIVLLVLFYLLPPFIAGRRRAGHRDAIFFINVLFGWTVLGWIAAAIWAIVEKPVEEKGR